MIIHISLANLFSRNLQYFSRKVKKVFVMISGKFFSAFLKNTRVPLEKLPRTTSGTRTTGREREDFAKIVREANPKNTKKLKLKCLCF